MFRYIRLPIIIALLVSSVLLFVHSYGNACSDGVGVYSKENLNVVVFRVNFDPKEVEISCECYLKKQCFVEDVAEYNFYTSDGYVLSNTGPDWFEDLKNEKRRIRVRLRLKSTPYIHIPQLIHNNEPGDTAYGLEYYSLGPDKKWYYSGVGGTEYYFIENNAAITWDVNPNYIFFRCAGNKPDFLCFGRFFIRNDVAVHFMFERRMLPYWKDIIKKITEKASIDNPIWVMK